MTVQATQNWACWQVIDEVKRRIVDEYGVPLFPPIGHPDPVAQGEGRGLNKPDGNGANAASAGAAAVTLLKYRERLPAQRTRYRKSVNRIESMKT